MKRALGIIPIILFFIAGIFFPEKAHTQERSFRVRLHSIDDSLITLPNDFIISNSIRLTVDSIISLQAGRDYTIDSSLRTLIFSTEFRKTLFSIPSGETRNAPGRTLEVKYSAFPLNLHRTYSRYKLPGDSSLVYPESRNNDSTLSAASQSNSASTEKTMNLTKSGGITRGIQAGSTQDLSFTNSFNLTFSGDLGDELSFKGAVSEESTPLQPEGNTQTLRDIDRIYIEMTAGKIFQATLGDHTLDLHPKKIFSFNRDPELDPIFNNFSRKVLGAKTDLQLGPTEVILSASAAKGKFLTLAIQGLDAVQGPYRLQGKNGERAIIVISGTEHVYIDGIELVRGELNDYVIDYGLAEIRFTNKRIITSSSRITVDFEYTDEQYSRTLIAGSQNTQFFNNKVQFSATYIREGDDENSPRNLTLSDSDKTILTNAGADPLKARKSGVVIAGRDTLGRARGNYLRIDTIITGKIISFYRYSPFDTMNAIYNIGFGYSGSTKGSYIRNGIGQFTFVGAGLGDYDTTVYLPLPQRNQLFTGQLTVLPINSLALTGEFAVSKLQPNLFSPINSLKDNAYHLYGSFGDTIGLALFGANYSERYKGANFSPIDRDRKVEELRSYGIDAPVENYSFAVSSERERKASLQFGITPAAVALQYGLYTRGTDIYRAERFGGIVSIREDSLFSPNAILAASHITASDSSIGTQSVWDSYSVAINKTYKTNTTLLTPAFQFISEKRVSNLFTRFDSLSSQSFSYNQFTPSLDIVLSQKIKFGASVQFRSEDSSRSGSFIHISNGTTYQFSSSLTNLSGFSSQVDVGYRRKDYPDSLSRSRNGGNVSSVLFRLIPRYQNANAVVSFDGIYEASEQRAATIQRVFFPVQKGLGNYKYLGDLNGNGKPDPEEFALAAYADEGAYILLTIPTEALFPVTDLRSSLHLRLNPLAFLGTETSIRIEENSSDPKSSDIYLFKLSHFLNDSTTLRGLIETQQDINLLDNDRSQSYRLRYLERKNALQYNTGLERLYYREFSLRGRFRPTDELSNETNIAQILDNARSGGHSTNLPHATMRIDISTEWTYEAFASPFGFGTKLGYSTANDDSFSTLIKSVVNSISINGRYSINSSTRLRTEIGRDELVIHSGVNALALPYSLTLGKSPATTWLWSLSLDVQIASGIVLTAGYNGRSELTNGIDRSVIHNARAEVRAAF